MMAVCSLTESSSSEAEEPGRADGASDSNSLTSVTDSEDSSSSDSESSDSSSGSCSQDQEATDATLTNVSQKTNLTRADDDLDISADRHDDSDRSANQESADGAYQEYSSSTSVLASAVESITSENLEESRIKQEPAGQFVSPDINFQTGAEFNLDEFQQFLQVNNGGAGPVDPVFVDHEDSQHAAHLDTLVFEDTETDQAVSGIPGLNSSQIGLEPDRIGLSLNMPNMDNNELGQAGMEILSEEKPKTDGAQALAEFEEGELPSSPGPTTDGPSWALTGSLAGQRYTEVTSASRMNGQAPGGGVEGSKLVKESEFITGGESEEERHSARKRKKKTKRRKKDTKDDRCENSEQSDNEWDSGSAAGDKYSRYKPKSKRFKADTKRPSKAEHKCHDKETRNQKLISASTTNTATKGRDKPVPGHIASYEVNQPEYQTKRQATAKAVLEQQTSNAQNVKKERRVKHDKAAHSKSSICAGDKVSQQQCFQPPPLPTGPPLPPLPPAANATCPAAENKPPSETLSSDKLSIPVSGETSKALRDAQMSPAKPSSADSQALSADSKSTSDESAKKKSKKISLKDYKAKKEAEKIRRELEMESSSESNSVPPSRATSIEPSPETSKESSPQPPERMDVDEAAKFPDGPNNNEEAECDDNDDALQGFDILDELDNRDESDNEEEENIDSDSLGEDEVHALLEEAVPPQAQEGDENPENEPIETHKKLILEERGSNVFEVLPLGWMSVTHNSGIPLYLHKETRVISTTRPYSLGNASVRKHHIPISAIPCYNYRYSEIRSSSSRCPVAGGAAAVAASSNSFTAVRETSSTTDAGGGSSADVPDVQNSVQASVAQEPEGCPAKPSEEAAALHRFGRANVSPDSTTDGAAEAAGGDKHVFPKARIETVEENIRKTELTPNELTDYCRRVFVFKEVEIAKFKTWKERRAYSKKQHFKRQRAELASRPVLPEGTKIITIPTVELTNLEGTDGDSALTQVVVKKSKKEWIMNPLGKSMVCLLHEYVQQSLRMQPNYEFSELDNSSTPYAATVNINGICYGRGVGSSKKIAKSEAARQTLEILIPEIKDKLPRRKDSAANGNDDADEPDLAFFNDIRVEDPRVANLCNRTGEPVPYAILITCLQRNYGLGDTHIHQELKPVRNGKNEYTMRVNKREVSVICKNKKDGKQLGAQKMLQQLHPHIKSWGSLLRMYGNRSIRKLKLKKEKETEVTGLQVRNSNSNTVPSQAILEKLKEEMRNLREIKKSVAPIGKFVPPAGVPKTGINTDHVDL